MSTSQLFPEVAEHRKPEHDIDPLFLNRWSARSYSDKPVSDEQILQVLEAARWAPSANNIQPWRFIVAQTPEQRETFLSFINPFNVEWCRKAPVLILVLSKKTNDKGDPNRAHAFDTGAAWGMMALQAVRLGLVTHAMGGYNAAAARTALHIPDDYDLHIVVSLGYRGPVEALSEERQAREKPNARRPIEETIVQF